MSLEKKIIKGWYSSYYGVKEKSEYYIYTTVKRKIITQIEIAE
jgi:hypothetical protein